MNSDIILSISLGIGLSAACGFRVFIPLCLAAFSAHLGWISPSIGFEWIGSVPALIVFGSAILFELAGYFIAWVDNALDSIATPLAVAAGIIISASFITDLSPLLRWTLAVIAGGGIAGVIQGGTVAMRLSSTAFTGGAANVVVAASESAAALVLSLLAVLLPVVALTSAVIAAISMIILMRTAYKKMRASKHA